MPLGDVGKGLFIGDKRDWLKVNGLDDPTDQSDYDIEDEEFGLPLKSRHLEDNFADILRTEDVKKVRFAEAKRRQTVEELLENTSNLNSYVEKNLERMGDLGSKLDCTEWYRSVTPDTTTAGSTRATGTVTHSGGSTSNFELSDVDDRDMSVLDADSDNDASVRDERVSSLLSAHFQLRSHGHGTSSRSPSLSMFDERRENTLLEGSLLRDVEDGANDDIQVEDADDYEDDIVGAGEYSSARVCQDAQGNDIVFPLLSSNEALDIFKNFLKLCLFLSSSHNSESREHPAAVNSEEEELRPIFCMKSSPTLSYSEYLDRIESKCSFPSVVYMMASFLLIRYCNLQYNEQHSYFSTSNHLQHNSVHRLIVALIRVSAKLLEDRVHSHPYFSKVCGISKKLLTKVELALVLILQSIRGGVLNMDYAVKLVLTYHKSIQLPDN